MQTIGWLFISLVFWEVGVTLSKGSIVCGSPNVRTVLFKPTDMHKECWTREEVALLFTRRMMQELIPRKKPLAIPMLLDYFKQCLETLKNIATNRRIHNLAVTAMADTLGGYLQAFGLPMANEAYYEGTLSYTVCRQLHELQTAFKKLLRTDGGGWTRPILMKRSNSVSAVKTPKCTGGNACHYLVTKKDIISEGKKKKNDENIDILLPFLDDIYRPTAIALPFKDRNLYSLSSRCACNILVKYYTRSVQCLIQTYGTCALPESGASPVPQANNFFVSFSTWLSDYVIPHLREETWYPGFGSVWRIVESTSRRGAPGKYDQSCDLRNEACQMEMDSGGVLSSAECEETSKKFYIIVIASVVIAFWLIVLIIYLLYRFFCRRTEPCTTDSEESYSTNASDTDATSSGASSSAGRSSK